MKLKNIYKVRSVVKKIFNCVNSPFLRTYSPGHYYSPIPLINDVIDNNRKNNSEKQSRICKGVELNEERQIDLLDKITRYYSELTVSRYPNKNMRYYYDNDFFSYADAIILFGIMRYFNPKRIIEVGSGFSSALMLDVNEVFFNNSIDFIFIDPFQERIKSLLKHDEKEYFKIINLKIQNVDLNTFNSLNQNDILFIDSSHVIKNGGDVNQIIFNILPNLNNGVIVHFHDIYWPFEYPTDWFLAGRAWNESYFIRSFLMYNNTFEILQFNSFVDYFYRELLVNKMPLWLHKGTSTLQMGPSSLWLKKNNAND